MPDTVDNGNPRWSTFDAAKVASLDSKVTGLDADVKQVHLRIDSLSAKIEHVAENLSLELRTGMAGLSKTMMDKGSTSWTVVFAGCAVAASLAGMIGTLALAPITADIQRLKADVVPRIEHEYRNTYYTERFQRDEARLQRFEDSRYSEMARQLDELRAENRNLRKTN